MKGKIIMKRKNFNLYFENSVRTDLIGYNMSTATVDHEDEDNIWIDNVLGMNGAFCCGHETDKENVLKILISENDRVFDFDVKYHRWTPAWCETIYRSLPQVDYYGKSGCIAVKEKKCISKDDVFVSEILITNNKKETAYLELDVLSGFEEETEGMYKAIAEIKASGLMEKYELNGWFCLFGVNEKSEIHLNAGESVRLKLCYAFNSNSDKARENAKIEYYKTDSFCENEKYINKWFYDNVPDLKINNSDIERIYYYRYLMLYINTFSPKDVIPKHYIEKRAIYENRYGEWYGCPITLSLPMQIDEAKWLKNHELAKEQLDVWKTKKLFQGFIEYTPYSAYDYYRCHKDKKWLEDIYDSLKECTLKKYSKDRFLPIMKGSWFTGAEYQSSFYQWTEPKWDWRQDEEGRRTGEFVENELYRLDEIMFFAANLKACSQIAEELKKYDDKALYDEVLKNVIKEVKEKFWNEDDEMFYDVDVKTGKQCDKAACYDSFMPFLAGLIDEEKYMQCLDKIFDSEWFYDEFSITTVAKKCPMYWFDNCIVYGEEVSLKNPHEYGCCWNGPIWPFAVTLVLNALGSAAKKYKQYRPKWCELFKRYTNLHFLNGNRSVPCILEHYRPGDGVTFSRSVDYFHSAWIDLFMKYWVGIDVENDEVTFEPFSDEEFELEGVIIGNKEYTITQQNNNGITKHKIFGI